MAPSHATLQSTKLLLQRRSQGDSARWRTVIRVTPAQMALTAKWVAVGQMLDPTVEWRLTGPQGNLIATQAAKQLET